MACGPSRKQLHAACTHTIVKALSTVTLVLLASSMVAVVGWAEPPPDGYSFNITHVDANRGFNSEELMLRAVNRSRLWAAAMLSATTNPPNILLQARYSEDATEYLMEFYIGGPKQLGKGQTRTFAVLDTGSSLVWMTQGECDKSDKKRSLCCSDNMCEGEGAIFSCDNRDGKKPACECRKKDNVNCPRDNHGGQKICKYIMKYGDKDIHSEGTMFMDQLTFVAADAKYKTQDVTFGCSSDGVHHPFPDDSTIRGVVGLDRGPQSLPRQLNLKFSYCLNNPAEPNLASRLQLRKNPNLSNGATEGAAVNATPLETNAKHPSRYFVSLESISIDGKKIQLQSGGNEQGGNMFIDSGASFTHLEEEAFKELLAEVDRLMTNKDGNVKLEPYSDNCYSGDPGHMPQIVLHFKSADMVLPWKSYLWYVPESKDGPAKTCLAIMSMKGMSVLGNFQQQNIHMLFDTTNNELKFVQAADCSKVG